MRSLNILYLLLVFIVYVAPLQAQQQKPDTAGLAAEMAAIYRLYAQKQYALDIRYTFAAASKPEKVLDSLTGRLEVVDRLFRYKMGNTTSIGNGRYNIILQSAMKKMHVSKSQALEQSIKMTQPGFPQAAVKSWSVSQKGNQRVFHVAFVTGFPFISLEVKKDMTTGFLTALRYLIPADQLERFGVGVDGTTDDFGDYAIVQVTYTPDKKYTPDMAVFDEQSYFRKTEKTLTPAAAFSGYQIFKASPDL